MVQAPEKPAWQVKRENSTLWASATAFETFELCNRKWWLSGVRKLEAPSRTFKVLGTVLHEVARRFLVADDLGRDPETGKPVDLYPPGWHIAPPKFGKPSEGQVTPSEQDQIMRLVTVGIENGVLERQPGRIVEREFNRTILEHEGVKVISKGFIDLRLPDQVQDHKTTSSMRYAKTPKTLLVNTQILIYAKELLLDAQDNGLPLPTSITLRHNTFCTDPNDMRVRKVEVQASIEHIDNRWKEILDHAREMIRLRRTVSSWHEIKDPPSVERSCNAFGGCPYRSICSGKESELGYENRINGVLARAASVPITIKGSSQTKGTSPMSSFASKLALKNAVTAAATSGVTPAPPINPPLPQTVAATPAPARPAPTVATTVAPTALPPMRAAVSAPVGVAAEKPPWAHPNCGACNKSAHPGFSTNGMPCRVCDVMSQKQNGPTSAMYVVMAVGDGSFVWEPKPGMEGTSGAAATPTAAVEIKAEVRTTQPAAAVPAPSVPSPAQTVAAQAEESLDGYAAKTLTGRPKKGFILVIGGNVTKGEMKRGSGRGVILLYEVLSMIGTDLAVELAKTNPKITSFYEINPFDRRDAIMKAGEAIASSFGTDVVVASGVSSGQSDMRALLDAIRPYAGMEIVGEAY